MKKSSNTISWIAVTFFGILTVLSLELRSPSGAVLFLICGALILPLETAQSFRDKIKLGKEFAVVLSIILMFAGVFTLTNFEFSTDYSSEDSEAIVINVFTDSEDDENLQDGSYPTTSDPTFTYVPETKESEPEITTVTEQTEVETTTVTEHTKTVSDTTVLTTAPEAPTGDNESKIVYITKTGKRYHIDKNCSGLKRAKEIFDSTISEVKDKNLTPCSICCETEE